ncbi:MAG: FtsX-like permease family protein [Chloroflexales bacterium]|nr:FtsX-like permease family protein [Chloroflexales bacterium]
MGLFLNFFGVLRVVLRRLVSNFGLLTAIVAGFIVAVALVTCIPIYAEAVGYRILREELGKNDQGSARPPFSFMYRYIGSQSGAVPWREIEPIETYMGERVRRAINLPVELSVRYASTDKVRALSTDPNDQSGEPLLWANLAFATDMEQHIDMLEGNFPKATGDGGPVEVLLSERKANELGLQVGEEYLILGPPDKEPKIELPVRISGVWRAHDASEPYWFYSPESFDDTLLMDEASFTGRVVPATAKPVYTALWFMVFDGESIRSVDAPRLTSSINRSLTDVTALLPGMALSISPYQALLRHQTQVRLLTILLTIFSLPLLGLVGYFIILVSGMVVQQQQNEIAVLRSRGTSRLQVLGIYLLEALALGALAVVLGPPLGAQAARLMTWTTSFLNFIPRPGLPIEITEQVWVRAAQVAALMLLASIVPALIATRYTIVSFKQERARSTRGPLWQRLFVDVLLLAPVWYGYQQLRERGTISFLGTDTPGGDPFSNPLLLLVPTLFVFSLTLLSLRLFPLLMRGLAWISALLPGTAILMAIRYLSRTTRGYTGPIMLLILTMSLATFTSSMSLTLDNQLLDRAYYISGADLRLQDLGEDTQPSSPVFGAQPPAAETPASGEDEVDEARWLFVPVTDYLSIPGVEAATRVGRSEVEANFNNKSEAAIFLGVDRADIGGVVGSGFRSDYARESLGGTMNLLADDPAAVLVSRNYAAKYGIRIGDKVTLAMGDVGKTQSVSFVVVGSIGLFPTLYPEDAPFFIGNLDYAFEQQGGQYPYEVWTKVAPGTTPGAVLNETSLRGLRVLKQEYAYDLIVAELLRPERQGVFGLLSIGFLAAAFLTVLGFLFYSVLSFRRRFVELGMLRAIGLSVSQMAALLTCEQGLIIGLGMGIGTLLGVTASNLFIPFLQVRAGVHPQTPPFIVQIAWDQIGIIYAIFGGMLVLAIIITMILLGRMRVFQAVKLGEAV